MEILGYFATLLIGLSLGLIGAGGSILALPVLVYLFGQSASLATAYSLVIVGVTALAGSVAYFRKNLVDLRTVIGFGPPSIAAVYLVRAYGLPAIPPDIAQIGGFELTRDRAILFLFAALMLGTAWTMVRPSKAEGGGPRGESAERRAEGRDDDPDGLRLGSGWGPDFNRASSEPHPGAERRAERTAKGGRSSYALVVVEGFVVGAVTGLVGAGGGFLIVPALVLLAGLPMRAAVGTSLVLIAAKSLIGFAGDLQQSTPIEWGLLAPVTGIAVLGLLIGTALAGRVPADRLRAGFGWFVLAMAALMVGRELLV
jgi:uncharacterized membrane protein YfcA